jgi:hypothetical protein
MVTVSDVDGIGGGYAAPFSLGTRPPESPMFGVGN